MKADPDSSVEGRKGRLHDRKATEAKLIDVASAIFASKGYEGATTRAIADQAGCSEALIQRYFQGKAGLLLAVVQAEGPGIAEQSNFFDRPLAASMKDEARETLSHLVEILARRSEPLRIVFSRVLLDPGFKEEFNRVTVRNFVRSRLESRFALHREAGRLPANFDAGGAAELLIGLGFQLGFVHREILQTKPADVARLVDQFADFFGRAFPNP